MARRSTQSLGDLVNWHALLWVWLFIGAGCALLVPLALGYHGYKSRSRSASIGSRLPRNQAVITYVIIALMVFLFVLFVASPIVFPASAIGRFVGGGWLEASLIFVALVVAPILRLVARVVRRVRRPSGLPPDSNAGNP